MTNHPAHETSDNQPIYVMEGGFLMPVAFVFLGFSFLYFAYQQYQNVGNFWALSLGIIGVVFLFVFVRIYKRRIVPMLIIDHEGLTTPLFKAPIPWRALESWEIRASKDNSLNIAVSIDLKLAPHYQPKLDGPGRGGSAYEEKDRMVYISAFNFTKDMSGEKLRQIMDHYKRQAK